MAARLPSLALALVLALALAIPLSASTGAAAGSVASPSPEAWSARLPGFAVHGSTRFVMVTDIGRARSERMLEVLERTADAVDRFALETGRERGRDGVRQSAADHRILCIAFAERGAFERFAREHDRVDAAWMMGYWAATDGRIVVRAETDAERRARSAGQMEADPSAPCEELATVAHEAAHQLLHHLGVQRRSPRMPLGLLEGLAMQFETCADAEGIAGGVAGGGAFGPQPVRERRLRERAGAIPPARILLTSPRLPSMEPAEIERFYDASWSLVRFLRERDPQAFAALLATVAVEAERLTPERIVALVERHFGSLEDLERAWMREVRGAIAAASGPSGRTEE